MNETPRPDPKTLPAVVLETARNIGRKVDVLIERTGETIPPPSLLIPAPEQPS